MTGEVSACSTSIGPCEAGSGVYAMSVSGGLVEREAASLPWDSEGGAALAGREQHIWNHWLQCLRTDASSAVAAALTYAQQTGAVRERWLLALESDLRSDPEARVAALAPLLAVERDGARSRRIAAALQPVAEQLRSEERPLLLLAELRPEERAAIVVQPLYLDFVQVLAVGYRPGRDVLWVTHDPIALRSEAPRIGGCFRGAILTPPHGQQAIEELAHTVWSHARAGGELEPALRLLARAL